MWGQSHNPGRVRLGEVELPVTLAGVVASGNYPLYPINGVLLLLARNDSKIRDDVFPRSRGCSEGTLKVLRLYYDRTRRVLGGYRTFTLFFFDQSILVRNESIKPAHFPFENGWGLCRRHAV